MAALLNALRLVQHVHQSVLLALLPAPHALCSHCAHPAAVPLTMATMTMMTMMTMMAQSGGQPIRHIMEGTWAK